MQEKRNNLPMSTISFPYYMWKETKKYFKSLHPIKSTKFQIDNIMFQVNNQSILKNTSNIKEDLGSHLRNMCNESEFDFSIKSPLIVCFGLALSTETFSHLLNRMRLMTLVQPHNFTRPLAENVENIFGNYISKIKFLDINFIRVTLFYKKFLFNSGMYEMCSVGLRFYLFYTLCKKYGEYSRKKEMSPKFLYGAGILSGIIAQVISTPLFRMHSIAYSMEQVPSGGETANLCFTSAYYPLNKWQIHRLIRIWYKYWGLSCVRGAVIGGIHLPLYSHLRQKRTQSTAHTYNSNKYSLPESESVINKLNTIGYLGKSNSEATNYPKLLGAFIPAMLLVTLVLTPLDKIIHLLMNTATISRRSELSVRKTLSDFTKANFSTRGKRKEFLSTMKYSYAFGFLRNAVFLGLYHTIFHVWQKTYSQSIVI